MAKYHINPATGNPNLCRATKGWCPFGGHGEHFPSKEAARDAYELVMTAPEEDLLPIQREMRQKFQGSSTSPEVYSEALVAMNKKLDSWVKMATEQSAVGVGSPQGVAYSEVASRLAVIMYASRFISDPKARIAFILDELLEAEAELEGKADKYYSNGDEDSERYWEAYNQASGSITALLETRAFDKAKELDQ